MKRQFIRIAWATHILSWFLKVHTGQKGAWISWKYGWEAFRVGLGPVWPGLNAVTSWSEGKPMEKGYSILVEIIPPFLSVPSALTNGWMLLFALALCRKKAEDWRACLFSGFVFCFCLNLFWLFSPLGLGFYETKQKLSGLCAGYYLWALSFGLSAFALMPKKESWVNSAGEVMRQILLPAAVAGFVFAAFFRIEELDRNLQKVLQDREKEKKADSSSASFRKLPPADWTSIPAASANISTPFLLKLEKEMKAAPSDPELLKERAYLYALWGDESACRKDFQQALAFSTNQPEVYWSMGWAFLNLERFDDAGEAWSKAWHAKSGEAEPRWVPSAMAMACWKSGRKNQALAWYQRAAERDPTSFTTLAGLQEHTSHWNMRERAWIIEVQDAWQRTYLGRNSGKLLKNRLSGSGSNAACSTCR